MSGKLKGKFTIAEIKKHLLTAISYLLPLIVASGLLIAIGNLTGGTTISSLDDIGSMTVPSAFTTLGGMGMGLIPAFIGGYIAYSVADRPGIAPGFLMGEYPRRSSARASSAASSAALSWATSPSSSSPTSRFRSGPRRSCP